MFRQQPNPPSKPNLKGRSMKTLTVSICMLALTTPMAIAQTSHSTMDHSNMAMSEEKMEGAVHAKAVVNSIGDGTVNVSHDPIPEIGWPAMTMDMPLTADAKIEGVAEGDEIMLMLIKGDDGMYAVSAMMPE
jgi:Cu(I)/Ag(I) efflux system periplasmic protein CusF